MSEAKTWEVKILAETKCTASFQETAPRIGDVLTVDFTWENAVKHPQSLWYGFMSIIDPNGDAVVTYIEFAVGGDPTGSHQLTTTADMVGEWKAEIQVWNGLFYIVGNDLLTVLGIVGEIDAATVYYDGGTRGFPPGTEQVILYLVVKNAGNEEGTISWELYEYPGETGEALLTSGTITCAKQTSCEVGDFIQTIPDKPGEEWPLGIKVKGADEVWPEWGTLGSLILANKIAAYR